ncbi:MAG: hypothetical protein K5873_06725, partial [Treponema sp.]|nr:hypothetical protein [Treponema sp.]
MKALLVADNEKAINNISEVLKTAGYDTIVYTWLLKALDNIEEIAPHLIVISTGDYPRHWKTLAQYASIGFGDYTPQVILYTDEHFNEEEEKKAKALKVRGCFDSIGVEGLDKLRDILSKNDDIFSGYLTEEERPQASTKKEVQDAGINNVEDKEEKSMDKDELQEEIDKNDESFDSLLTKFEATKEEECEDSDQTLEDIEKSMIEAEDDEKAADRLEQINQDEMAADRLVEITGDEVAADRLVRMEENEEVLTVEDVMNEPYNEE